MLKKLSKTDVKGIYRWEVYVRTREKQIHRVVEMTEPDATEFYADLLKAKARQKSNLSYTAPVSRMTLGDAAVKYEKDMYATGLNAVHINGVLVSLRILREILGDTFPVAQIRAEHVRTWREKRQTTIIKSRCIPKGRMPGPSTVNKSLLHLSAFMAFCCENEWMESNPALLLKKIKQIDGELRILSWRDFITFADASWGYAPFGLLVEILGETGARIDEVLRARVSDVDLFRKTWRKIVKPGKVVVMDAGSWVLHAALGKPKDDYLCPLPQKSEDGKSLPFTYAMVHSRFDSGFTPHWVRHGRACWDLIDGKTIYQVKERLGHCSVAVTERYLKAYPQLKREEEPGTLHIRDVDATLARVSMCSKSSNSGPVLTIIGKHGPSQEKGDNAVAG
jgi:integrase